MVARDRAPGSSWLEGAAPLVVRVGDRPDTPPEFVRSPPVARIPENLPPNSGVVKGTLKKNRLLITFKTESNMIVVTVSFLIMNPTEFRLVHKEKDPVAAIHTTCSACGKTCWDYSTYNIYVMQ